MSKKSPVSRLRDQAGAVSLEYVATAVVGIGFAILLLKLLLDGFGASLIETVVSSLLGMVGIG